MSFDDFNTDDDSEPVMLDGVPQCPNCRAFHTDDKTGRWVAAVCAGFNPGALCRLCGNPVGGLSMGGPEICPSCDAGPEKKR